MPVLPPDLEDSQEGGEKSHQKGSRTANAPSGVLSTLSRILPMTSWGWLTLLLE